MNAIPRSLGRVFASAGRQGESRSGSVLIRFENCTANNNHLSKKRSHSVVRTFTSFTSTGGKGDTTTNASGASDPHALFQEQMLELEQERRSLFLDGEPETRPEEQSTAMTGEQQHAFFAEELKKLEQERQVFFGENTPNATFDFPTATAKDSSDNDEKENDDNNMIPKDMDKLHDDRQAIFEFSEHEKNAWSQQDFTQDGKLSPQLMMEIAEARAAQERGEIYNPSLEDETSTTSSSTMSASSSQIDKDLHHPSFSHVSQDGGSVHMVDVGHKEVTTRMAEAQTKVILPDSVMEAFGWNASTDNQNELIGPKGPILATAKLAGIMAAKKTSDLIPLCHALPLDQVKLDIRLVKNEVLINCVCRVTHKTGVEMEALTGATVAALTVYDMVKAVSHEVEITDTRLVAKTGGKRTVGQDKAW